MKVFTIWLGNVEANEVETLLTSKADELGYAFLNKRYAELTTLIEQASSEHPCDASDERELQEVDFMRSLFLDEEGYVKDDIPF